jgi:uncharacterized protein DUF3305
MQSRPSLSVAVLMERRKSPNPWQEWGFRIADVVADIDEPGVEEVSPAPRLLRDDSRTAVFVHPRLRVTLFRDEAEGYYLNLTSPDPVWFVVWRIDDNDASRAWPECVTLSYDEAARLLDANEHVDPVPLPGEVRDWLQAFVDEHYKPKLKTRVRPMSFVAPDRR